MKHVSHPIWSLRKSETEDDKHVLIRSSEERDVDFRVVAGQHVQIVRNGQMVDVRVIITDDTSATCTVQSTEDELVEEIPVEFIVGIIDNEDPFEEGARAAIFNPEDYDGEIDQIYILDEGNDYGLPAGFPVENVSQMDSGALSALEEKGSASAPIFDQWEFKPVDGQPVPAASESAVPVSSGAPTFTVHMESAGGNMTPEELVLPNADSDYEAVPDMPGESVPIGPLEAMKKAADRLRLAFLTNPPVRGSCCRGE